jgi:hypothetical protein
MVKLNQVLGAILSDITQAQFISDAYSRDLKLSYREDPVLKLLSVPRTEIKDVTIDLKFAILKPQDKVVIYQDGSYQGATQELDLGNYDIESLAIGDKQLSSLRVPKGIKVTLYEHPGFTGQSKIFTEDTPWVGDDFNDLTSSIKVEQTIESMEIEVVTGNLTNLPDVAISSIVVKLDLASV